MKRPNNADCKKCVYYEKDGSTFCGFTTHECYKHKMSVEQMSMLHIKCNSYTPIPTTSGKCVNKIILNGETIIDLTGITVKPEALKKGYTAHDKSGKLIIGTGEFNIAKDNALNVGVPFKWAYGDKVYMDLSEDTVTEETLLKGYTAVDRFGVLINGKAGDDE